VESYADGLGRLVERRADVDVLTEPVSTHRLEDQPGQLVDRRHVLHEQDPGRLADALDVLADLEAVQPSLVLVPVGADALERRRAVHERVGHDADLRVLELDELALEIAGQVVEAARRRGVVGRRGGSVGLGLGRHVRLRLWADRAEARMGPCKVGRV
jgi:hypothetical protein